MINEVSINLPSRFLIFKIPTSFDNNFKQISKNIRIEVAKLEPEPTFESTSNEIKDNHMKNIASAAMTISAITSFDKNFKQISLNSKIEVAKF